MDTKNGLKNFRLRKKIKSQGDFAAKLGITQTSISDWELGKSVPSFQVAKKLIEMGITVEELFGVSYNPDVTGLNMAEVNLESELKRMNTKFEQQERRLQKLEEQSIFKRNKLLEQSQNILPSAQTA